MAGPTFANTYSITNDKLYLKSPLWDSPSVQGDLLHSIASTWFTFATLGARSTGLHGQYHFRLCLTSRTSTFWEDYIVRFHGNYLMERSVSVELPDLPAGNHVVDLKDTSEQDSNAQSVEQVLKREAADRNENEHGDGATPVSTGSSHLTPKPMDS
ncbi:calpain [Fusarium mundagurra]|uniref:Calpain n=1 Tax=Fusarium mundagurra TaxID=1567541 RepID=A0A8H6DRI1_9HYPO|nr:calpain [Fusarium mundagurra]